MDQVVVSEHNHKIFTEKIQKYLDEGYELKGKTHMTTLKMYDSSTWYFYNQLLVRNSQDDESAGKKQNN